LRLPLNVQKPKVLQLQEGFTPCPLSRGSDSRPRWGLLSQTFVIGSCYRARHGAVPTRYWGLEPPLIVECKTFLLRRIPPRRSPWTFHGRTFSPSVSATPGRFLFFIVMLHVDQTLHCCGAILLLLLMAYSSRAWPCPRCGASPPAQKLFFTQKKDQCSEVSGLPPLNVTRCDWLILWHRVLTAHK